MVDTGNLVLTEGDVPVALPQLPVMVKKPSKVVSVIPRTRYETYLNIEVPGHTRYCFHQGVHGRGRVALRFR